jgi:hypothetical protein
MSPMFTVNDESALLLPPSGSFGSCMSTIVFMKVVPHRKLEQCSLGVRLVSWNKSYLVHSFTTFEISLYLASRSLVDIFRTRSIVPAVRGVSHGLILTHEGNVFAAPA